MTKVSIIIPCYKHQYILPRAVSSALNQVNPNCDYEIVIVDDGNIDPIKNVWGNPVRVIRHSTNKGLSNALNTGISMSTGQYFVILAADDELHPDYLNKTTPYMNEVDVISTNFKGDSGIAISAKPGSFNDLIRNNCHTYAALIRKAKFQEIPNGFKSYMNPSWEDWLMFLELAQHEATWHHVPLPLHIYHRNPTGRDVESQDRRILLTAKFQGTHPEIYGTGRGEVAVIIPCYNHEQFLPEALTSIVNQVYPHIRVIVVDDGSPNNVIKAVKPYEDKLNLTVLRQHNHHLSSARNTGIYYALDKFNSDFFMMLDADDAIHPLYVERCLSEMSSFNQYVYTDIKFIGDAFHTFELEDYKADRLVRKHLHQCTFVAHQSLYSKIRNSRNYCYDEAMVDGFEDWEFALEALKNGFCGKRIPKEYLFFYRFHANGSMRTDAQKIEKRLVNYVKNKQPWVADERKVEMACSSCGGNKFTKVVKSVKGSNVMQLNVQGVGLVDANEMIEVTYLGNQSGTITKLGTAGNVYKYSNGSSSYGKTFTIFAKDVHLFPGNQFSFRRISNAMEEPAPTTAFAVPASVKEVLPAEVAIPADVAKFANKLTASMKVVAIESDDFTKLGLTKAEADKLQANGFTFYADVADASVEEVCASLKCYTKKATTVIEKAKELVK